MSFVAPMAANLVQRQVRNIRQNLAVVMDMALRELIPAAAAAAKLLQSCPTLCDLMDCSPPGFPVPGILQARTLEWVAISFSNAWKWKVKVKSLSHVQLLATPWTAAHQAPPPMGFPRQGYWSGVPLPSLGPRATRCKSTHQIHMFKKFNCWSFTTVIMY